jgi:hypothetical protein
MTPEQIKKLEAQGARASIISTLIKASGKLTEACHKYSSIEPDGWGAHDKLTDCAKEIKLHSNTINTLINHLQPGT